MNTELTERQLAERLAELPREVPPVSDPWPKISDRIAAEPVDLNRIGMKTEHPGQRPWARYLGAMAASLALAFVAGWMWGQRDTGPHTPELASGVLSEGEALMGQLASFDAEYDAALGEFNQAGHVRGGLPASTVFEIEKGWAILEATEQSLQLALENNPDDPFLVSRLMDLRSRQLEFLRQLEELDQVQRRSSI